MKLLSLEIKPNPISGWASPILNFGNDITQLYAKNESGKTPIIQSIIFCLGYPVDFRADIIKHCASANLVVEIEGVEYVFIRRYDSKFDLTVKKDNLEIHRFYNEADFSKFILPALGYAQDRLVTTSNQPSPPYVSAVIPIFYLDQDRGYSEYYFPANSFFIKNQFPEMVRLAAGFPPINSYDRKEKVIEVRNTLKYLDHTIIDSRKLLQRLRGEVNVQGRNIDNINSEVDTLKKNLENLKNTKDIKSEALNSFDVLIHKLRSQLREVISEEHDLQSKISSSKSIQKEIESEIETLALNEESLSAFRTLSEICSTPNCGMFFASSESYGKSLLYLKDQIKDLATSTATNQQRLDMMTAERTVIEKSIQELSEERGQAVSKEGIDLFVKAISQISSSIFDLELQKTKLLQIKQQESNYLNLQLERDRNISLEESMQGSREPSAEMITFRRNLAIQMADWLDTLRSMTISREVKIDSEFKPILGEEKLKVFKGSSKARTVLAYHAALFSQLLSRTDSGFRFLIFDTPRQHELQIEDLDDYMQLLKQIARDCNAQIIFSTTSYRYSLTDGDEEWLPSFPQFNQPMYLG